MALDSYNGAVLWSLEIPQLRRVNIPRDASNMYADEEGLFLAVKDACWRIDGRSGRRVATYHVDQPDMDWGVVFREKELLYGSAVREGSIYTKYWGEDYWYEGYPGLVWGGTHEAAANQVFSDALFAVDPATGSRNWTYRGGMILNTTVAFSDGFVLFVESRTPQVQEQLSGQGGTIENALRAWDDIHLVALDAVTGEKLWERSLSDEQDDWPAVRGGVAAFYLLTAHVDGDLIALIQSSYPVNQGEPDFTEGTEDNGYLSLNAYHVTTTDVRHQWSARQRWKWVVKKKLRRAVVTNGRVILATTTYRLTDGRVESSDMPEFGCGTPTAIGDIVIARFDDVGAKDTVYDITLWNCSSGKLSSWTPLRPSCWLSTISGGGMLLAPEAGGGCSCQLYFGASVGFAPNAAVQP